MQSPNEYFNKSLKPILQPLFVSIFADNPCDIISYSINWLRRKGNYTNEGLTPEEKDELNLLRKINSNSSNSDNDSSSESSEQDISNETSDSFQMKTKPRNGVCGDIINNNINEEYFSLHSLTHKNKAQEKAFFIKTSLLNSFLFSSLDSNDLNIIISSMKEVSFKKNEIVIQQGDEGNCLYLVLHGELNCFKTINNENKQILVKTYFRGEIFGELSILYNSPRAATVIATSDNVSLLKLNRETFSVIVKEGAKQKLEKYESFIKNVEIFSTMGPYEILKICDALFEMDFNRGDYVITEGELDDYFYIVSQGTAHAIKKFDNGVNMIVKEYSKADYFGELALIRNAPRAVSVIATSVSIFYT